jgi:transcriptional regulator with XRE-family HTH domain
MTEQELADELGFSQNKMNKIENGSTKLTVEDAEKIADVLGMKASELIPSLATIGSVTSNDHSTAGGVVFQSANFDTERRVWEKLEKSAQEIVLAKEQTIIALNALISAQNLTIEELKRVRQ